MLNTVPQGVSLTEIQPIAVKPVNVTLTVGSSGAVTLSGAIRVSIGFLCSPEPYLITPFSSQLLGSQFASNPSRKVTVKYTTADGKTVSVAASTSATFQGTSTYLGGAATYYYSFSAPVKSTASITSFVVSTQENTKSSAQITPPFTFQDTVAFLPGMTSGTLNTEAGTLAATLSAAVRTDHNVKSVEAVLTLPVPRANGVPTPELQTFTVQLAQAGALGSSKFALYQAAGSIPLPSSVNWTAAAPFLPGASFDVVATLADGTTVTDEFRTFPEASISVA
jgi:hypothetical protein